MPMTSTLSPALLNSARDERLLLGDRVEVVLADVDHDEHAPVGEQEVGRQRLADVGLESGAVEREALGERVERDLQVGGLLGHRLVELRLALGLVEPLLDGLEVGEREFESRRCGGARAGRSGR